MNKRRSRRRKLPTTPVELDINSLSHEGRGVAHIDGKVAFVDGALAGEQVSATYVRRRSQFDELRVDAVKVPSRQRTEPPCQFASQCGGCSLQHMDADAQIQFKQSVLLDTCSPLPTPGRPVLTRLYIEGGCGGFPLTSPGVH